MQGDPGDVEISTREKTYLCKAASEYFKAPVLVEHIVSSTAGVRPLFGEKTADGKAVEASKLTRDSVLELDGGEGEPALLSIFGGKITTYRVLAQKVLAKLDDYLPPMAQKKKGARDKWTAMRALPGGDFAPAEFEGLVAGLQQSCDWMDETIATRLVRAYGSRAMKIFTHGGSGTARVRGEDFGCGLCELEVLHLIESEWARTAQDILWRRTKLGLYFTSAQVAHLENWLQARAKEPIA